MRGGGGGHRKGEVREEEAEGGKGMAEGAEAGSGGRTKRETVGGRRRAHKRGS